MAAQADGAIAEPTPAQEPAACSAATVEQLFSAARDNNVDGVASTLASSPNAIHFRDATTNATIAHWMALHGQLELLQKVRDLGGEMNAPIAASGMAPMHWACTRGWVHIVEYLHETCGVSLEMLDLRKTTPLMLASQYNNVAVARWLLDHGVDAHARDKDSDTALHWACYKDGWQTVQLLVARGVDPCHQDAFGSNALHLAASAGAAKAAKFLLTTNSAPTLVASTDNQGRTPLVVAEQKSRSAIRHAIDAYISEAARNGSAPMAVAHDGSGGRSAADEWERWFEDTAYSALRSIEAQYDAVAMGANSIVEAYRLGQFPWPSATVRSASTAAANASRGGGGSSGSSGSMRVVEMQMVPPTTATHATAQQEPAAETI